jgi:hypothetical protein
MKIATLALASSIIAAIAFSAHAQDGRRGGPNRVATDLSGYNEVHFSFSPGSAGPPPVPPSAAVRGAVSTNGNGQFSAHIDEDAGLIRYELSYDDLQGAVTQAHIHFGQRHTVSGIVVWLCETDAAQHPVPSLRRPVTPQCPPSGTVTGTIGPDKVIDVPGQGIAAGEFAELVRAIRAGATYVNVHSALFPLGEIRGQLHDHGAGR